MQGTEEAREWLVPRPRGPESPARREGGRRQTLQIIISARRLLGDSGIVDPAGDSFACLQDADVSVTVLMPGVTETNVFDRAEMLDTKAGATDSKDDPAVVAKAAFEALQAGSDKITPKAKNKLMSALGEALPEPVVAAMHRPFAKPGSAR